MTKTIHDDHNSGDNKLLIVMKNSNDDIYNSKSSFNNKLFCLRTKTEKRYEEIALNFFTAGLYSVGET